MEDQRQTLWWVHQESLGDHIQGFDLDLKDGICPTRAHYLSHWVSNPHKILGSNYICGKLIQLLICLYHEGNLI